LGALTTWQAARQFAAAEIGLGGGDHAAPDGAPGDVILRERLLGARLRDGNRALAMLVDEQAGDHPNFEPIGFHHLTTRTAHLLVQSQDAWRPGSSAHVR